MSPKHIENITDQQRQAIAPLQPISPRAIAVSLDESHTVHHLP